jgi:catechol 2,3-dioxygenase
MDTQTALPAAGQVPTATRLGPVHIAVTDAERAIAVWRDLVGLTLLSRQGREIVLGAGGKPLIVLESGAERPVVEGTSGLYHVALHVPARRDLAVVIARLFTSRFRNAPTDHLVTETTYLWDLDGNGIEVTFETPWRGDFVTVGGRRQGVTADGRPHSGKEAVDLESLFGELGANPDLREPLPPGTRVGHVNLHVSDLHAAQRFYTEALGFPARHLNPERGNGDVVLDYPPHIIAFNTWQGEGAPQPPPGSAGLRHFTVTMPDTASLSELHRRLTAAGAPVEAIGDGIETRDPAGNRLRIGVAG